MWPLLQASPLLQPRPQVGQLLAFLQRLRRRQLQLLLWLPALLQESEMQQPRQLPPLQLQLVKLARLHQLWHRLR